MKLIETQWSATKKRLLEGKDIDSNFNGTKNENKRAIMNTLFDNTRKEIMMLEHATAGATNAASIATINRVIFPILRRVMPTVIAHEIMGVQPMTSPVGQIHSLRVRYANTVPTNGGGVSAGAEAFSPFDIARFYSGNGNPAAPGPVATANMEGRIGPQMNIQIVKQIVEAQTRKLSATWTIEAQQDANAMHGIDIEAEIMSTIAQELTAEIDQEMLFRLRALPGAPVMVFNQNAVTGTPTFIGDVHAAFATMVNYVSNLISVRTRRGAGNWMVVSPTTLTILQSASTSAFARTTDGVFEAPTNTKYCGTLNNSVRVYVDSYADHTTPALIGYKGSETDAAAYYCPYVPLTSTGVVMNAETMMPTVSFMTRYGYVELTNSSSSLGNSADYLGLIGIDPNITFM